MSAAVMPMQVAGNACQPACRLTGATAARPPLFCRRGRRTAPGTTRIQATDSGDVSKLTYKAAGVDIDAGDELVRRIAKMVPGVGGFGGFFPFGDSFLVAGTDGVGTKLKLAFELNKHDTVGIDLVAMSVNDVVTTGAKPLFFLDYYATGRLDVDVAEKVVRGIVAGCKQCDCALLGGETAEMPGFYTPGEYDLAGFAVGAVKKDKVIDGRHVRVGDKLVGLPSSGVHSNGFSLVRRILKDAGKKLADPLPGGGGISLGDALIAPTIIYVKQVLELAEKIEVKALSHITGEGLPGNVPRVLPEGVGCRIIGSSWPRTPLFSFLQSAGAVAEAEMFRTFNMGIGMVIVVSPTDAAAIVAGKYPFLGPAYVIGDIVAGAGVQMV